MTQTDGFNKIFADFFFTLLLHSYLLEHFMLVSFPLSVFLSHTVCALP